MRLFQRDRYVSLDLLQKTVEVYKLVKADQISTEQKENKTVVGNIPVEEAGKTVVYERPKVSHQDMLTSELQSFLHAVGNRTTPKVTGEDGRKALQVALQIKNKAEEHKNRSIKTEKPKGYPNLNSK
jgi:predicted dehydrogenase